MLEGNPAGVVPFEAWPDASVMQSIAAENNLAETAFFVKTAPGAYDLRWFTPTSEVELCGHATLASADVIFRFLDPGLREVRFQTRSGELKVARGGPEGHMMAMPAAASSRSPPPLDFIDARRGAGERRCSAELHYSSKGGAGAGALIAVWPSPDGVRGLNPGGDLEAVLLQVKAGSLVATSPGDRKPYDFVSRFFAPHFGVPEDPVTGSGPLRPHDTVLGQAAGAQQSQSATGLGAGR